jgi:hypothetical protein
LLTSGNHVAGGDLGSGWVGLSQDLQAQSEAPTTKYLSFLMRLDGGIQNGFAVMIDGSRSDMGAGASASSSGRYMIETFYNAGTRSSDVKIERDVTSLLVVKADLRDGRDEFTLFVNPTVGDPEPTEGVLKNDIDVGTVRGIAIGASGQISVDEIRWGDSFADVTPSDMPVVFGDFDGDGLPTIADVDSLVSAFDLPPTDVHDLNSDGSVDADDLAVWVTDAANTYSGDANLDGEFNSADMVAVFQAGKYEVDIQAGWADGDWTGDGRFDSSDMVAAFQGGGYELGTRASVSAVPEPTSGVLLAIGAIAICRLRRR